MKVYSLKCPACGASLTVNEDRESFYCEYCGELIYVDDEIDRSEVVHRYIDEGEIVKSNNRLEEKKLEAEERHRRFRWYNAIIIGGVICYILLFVYAHFHGG